MTDGIEVDYMSILSPYEDMLRDNMNVPKGYVYRPIGWTRNDFYDQLIDLIGDENLIFVSSMTKRFEDKSTYTRASVFVSEQGIKNIGAYLDGLHTKGSQNEPIG